MGARLESNMDLVRSAHRHIDEGLRHHRVRLLDGRQPGRHRAKGNRGLLDRFHCVVVRALLVGARIDRDPGARGRILVGGLVDSVLEKGRRADRHPADLDVRIGGEIDAGVNGPGSLQVTEANHVRLSCQDVDLHLAVGRRGRIGPRKDRGHIGGHGRGATQRGTESESPARPAHINRECSFHGFSLRVGMEKSSTLGALPKRSRSRGTKIQGRRPTRRTTGWWSDAESPSTPGLDSTFTAASLKPGEVKTWSMRSPATSSPFQRLPDFICSPP